MRPRVFNLVTAVSLLLCVGTVSLWVRSYWIAEGVQRVHREANAGFVVERVIAAYSESGCVSFASEQQWQPLRPAADVNAIAQQARWRAPGGVTRVLWPKNDSGRFGPTPRAGWKHLHSPLPGGSYRLVTFAGFRYFHASSRARAAQSSFAVGVPWLAVTLIFAIIPIARMARLCRERWRLHPPRHLCHRCGYNLTGNTSGVCPECGTATSVGVKA